ncbi:hypothetical protein [Streptomyces sp. NBC_01304]|uniref:hypothetical protein n=1 Tax=Streptomyces sp. NBC_01304 TaxID=2903818 RepID=UPI002E10B014|nr:hypothetical protein OG430_07775 [Streptomyces sp. NBC_01304]
MPYDRPVRRLVRGHAGCVLGSDRRAARARVVKLVKDLDAALLDFDGTPVTGQTVVGPFGDALYRRSSWHAISPALSGLITYSNPSPLLDLTAPSAGRPEVNPPGPSGGWGRRPGRG